MFVARGEGECPVRGIMYVARGEGEAKPLEYVAFI